LGGVCPAGSGVAADRRISAAGKGTERNKPLNIFQNYFVTGDYVVAGWSKGAPDGSGYAPGTISIPDTLQPTQDGVPASVPKEADIVAYLYWATVESDRSSFAGQTGYFNDYPITGTGAHFLGRALCSRVTMFA
jgi:hypothetical protein